MAELEELSQTDWIGDRHSPYRCRNARVNVQAFLDVQYRAVGVVCSLQTLAFAVYSERHTVVLLHQHSESRLFLLLVGLGSVEMLEVALLQTLHEGINLGVGEDGDYRSYSLLSIFQNRRGLETLPIEDSQVDRSTFHILPVVDANDRRLITEPEVPHVQNHH